MVQCSGRTLDRNSISSEIEKKIRVRFRELAELVNLYIHNKTQQQSLNSLPLKLMIALTTNYFLLLVNFIILGQYKTK